MKEKKSLNEFVKEHRHEFVYGCLCTFIGVYIGKRCELTKTKKKLVNNLKDADPVFKGCDLMNNINRIFEGCKTIYTFKPTDGVSVHDLADYIKDVYGLEGSKIKTTGALIFTK